VAGDPAPALGLERGHEAHRDDREQQPRRIGARDRVPELPRLQTTCGEIEEEGARGHADDEPDDDVAPGDAQGCPARHAHGVRIYSTTRYSA
jgi:hypothetical protein